MERTTGPYSDDRDSLQLVSGSTISHYHILEPLGHGGMGVVYKAEDTRLRRLVALKFLSVKLTQSSDALERLRREARAASSLNHPHICAIHDLDEQQTPPFLVMEFLEGETLRTTMAGRPMALSEILRVARQVTDALQAAHDKQIIHRDIKPSNIMITARGEVKVLDFGLAKISGGPPAEAVTEMTAEGTILGTAEYMSPEQALGHTIDHRSDLFSLGVMLYEMATGRLPFSGSTAMEVMNRIINAEPEAITSFNVNIPPGLERIIGRCLEKSVENRFQSARELLNDLRKEEPDTVQARRPGIRHNLPLQLSSFVGRQRELGELHELLKQTRLLTLSGSGGIGKTRLALEVAAQSVDSYPDGVWFVELAAVLDEALVPQAVASTFGLRDERGRAITNTLADYVRQRNMLLVLDNCEQVIGACAELADTLLRTSSGLRILTTSREALAITGEAIFRVPPLEEGIELFINRARSVKSAFDWPRQSEALAKICRRLDGIPLAIELAASRVKVMSIEQIEARLEDRWALLKGGSRTALPRHQTLHAAIDWSYNLLPPAEQTLFRRLSLFPGGWSLETAEAVCSGNEVEPQETLDLLSALVNKSLVLAEESEGRQPYRLMTTLLDYAHQRLLQTDEAEAMLHRRAAFFLVLAKKAKEGLIGSDQKQSVDVLRRELDNLRATLNWARTANPEIGLRLAVDVARFWQLQGHLAEGRWWLTELLARQDSEGTPLNRGLALNALAALVWMHGDYVTSRSYSEEALKLFRELGNAGGMASALTNLGNISRLLGESEAELSFHEQALAICREAGDKRGIAVALNNLGIRAEAVSDYPSACALHEESLAIRREIGDRFGVAISLNNLGNLVYQSEPAKARTLYEESISIRRELGDKPGMAISLNNLGVVLQKLGEFAEAEAAVKECLALQRESGDKAGVGIALVSLGELAFQQGDVVAAAASCNEALALLRTAGYKYGIANALSAMAKIAERQDGYTAAEKLYNESITLFKELGEKHSTANALKELAEVAERNGNHQEADSRFKESLVIHRSLGARTEAASTLESLATLELLRGRRERAAHLLGASRALRERTAVPQASKRPDAGAEMLCILEGPPFDAGLNAGRSMTFDEAVDYALGSEIPRFQQ